MPKYTIAQFAAEMKAKYPDYSSWDDAHLVREIVGKYPEYADWVDVSSVEGADKPKPATSFAHETAGVLSQINRGLTSPLRLLPWGAQIQEAVLPREIKPETTAGQFIGRVGEEIGAGASGTALGVGLAGRYAGAIPEVEGPIRGALSWTQHAIKGMIDELAAMPPWKLARLDAYISTASGSGAATAQQIAPDNKYAEMAGQLIGQFGVMGTQQLIRSQLERLLSSRNISGRIGRTFDNITGTSEQYAANWERSRQLEAEFPELKLTSSQASNDPAFKAIEAELASRDPDFVSRLHERYYQQNESIRKATEAKIAIPRNASPERLNEIMQERIRLIEQPLEGAYRRAQDDLAEYMRNVGPSRLPEENAAALRAKVEDVRAATAKERRVLYAAIDPDQKLHPDVSRIMAARDEIYGGVALVESRKHVPEVLDRLGKWPKPKSDPVLGTIPETRVPSGELMALDREINESVRALKSAANPDWAEIRRLEMLRNSVDSVKNEILNTPRYAGEASDVIQRWNQAEQFFIRHEVEKFGQGAMVEATRFQSPSGSEFKLPTSDFIGHFFKANRVRGALEKARDLPRVFRPTGRSEVDDLIHVLGGPGTADRDVLDWAKSQLATAGMSIDKSTGAYKASVGGMQKWIDDHRLALNSFPKVRDRLKAIAGNSIERQKIVDDSLILTKAARQDVDQGVLGAVANMDPDSAFNTILLSKNPKSDIAKLRNVAGERWEEVRRGIASVAYEKAFLETVGPQRVPTPTTIDPQASAKFLRDNDSVLRIIWTPEERAAIDLVNEAYATTARGTRGTLRLSSAQDPTGSKNMETIINRFQSRFWGVARNVVGLPYVVTDISLNEMNKFLNGISGRKAGELLKQSLLDPDVARTFQLLAKLGSREAVMKRLRGHLINLGGQDKDKSEPEE